MEPSQACPAGMSFVSLGKQSETIPGRPGKPNIKMETDVLVCRPNKTDGRLAAQGLKALKGGKKTGGGEKNHGMLPIEVRGKALAREGRGHAVRGPRGSSSGVKSFTPGGADDPAVKSKRAQANSSRAAGTPKK